jgi:hypothetical protein
VVFVGEMSANQSHDLHGEYIQLIVGHRADRFGG